LPAGGAAVPFLSGGFLYGEGVFTTLRLYRGRAWDLAGHLARLRDNSAQLELASPPALDELETILRELAARNGLAGVDARARVVVCRGQDPGRLLPLTHLAGIPVLLGAVVLPLAPELARWQRDGVRLLTLEAGSDRGALADLKSLCYLASVLALRRAAAAGCQEALLVDPEGRVREAATSNVFAVRRDGMVVTPPATGGLLAGRTRAAVIELARARAPGMIESEIERGELAAAAEVFVTGSVKEVVPAVEIDGEPVGDGRPGPVTRRLQEAYASHVRAALGSEA
jgi:branched-chain amino acid aminotransferase